jgi:hypothetical protein
LSRCCSSISLLSSPILISMILILYECNELWLNIKEEFMDLHFRNGHLSDGLLGWWGISHVRVFSLHCNKY